MTDSPEVFTRRFRRVAIRYYRSIVSANLKLGDITVVIGPSDAGKSNLIRALRDWAYNAGGYSMITDGKSVARVGVAIGESRKVVWEKEAEEQHARTRYIVGDARTGANVAYEKVGLSVPQEVIDLTGIRPVLVDDVSVRINFAEQGEPWFLLANPPWTPGRVTKIVGKVSGVDSLVLANRDLVKARQGALGEAKAGKAKAELRRRELATFSALPDALELLRRAEEASGRLQDRSVALERCHETLRRIRDGRRALDVARTTVEEGRKALARVAELDLEAVLSRHETARVVADRYNAARARMTAAAERATSLGETIGRLESELATLADDKDLRCPLCGRTAHAECRKALKEG